MPSTTSRAAEIRAYYRLCADARALGIPTSLDDPRTPATVAGLKHAVAVARRSQ